jgi:hypothetical protein
MFIRLHLAETGGAFYVNTDRVLYFGKMMEATAMHFTGGEVRRIRETPAEICALLAEASK